MKLKKGELTTQQIVGLIILITSFVIILFFLFRLNIGKESKSELCHNSAILKSKSIFPKDTTQLSCYRSYKCITQDGSCEGLNNPEIVKVDNITKIYSELANEMTDCWWMFGNGNVNYVGKDFLKNNYCSICSQVLFDNSLNKINGVKNGQISKDELYDYISKTKMSDGKNTYAEYLFGTNNIEQLKQASSGNGGPATFGNIDVGKQFFVVMGITSEVSTTSWWVVAVGGTIAGTVIATSPIGWIAGAGVAITSIAAGVAGSEISQKINPEISAIVIKGKGVDNNFMSPTVVEANSDRFKALNCQEILTYT